MSNDWKRSSVSELISARGRPNWTQLVQQFIAFEEGGGERERERERETEIDKLYTKTDLVNTYIDLCRIVRCCFHNLLYQLQN